MQALQQSYTQYFNRTYATVGHLFQGRYKAFVCHRDSYVARLVRYIHLNPVRAGLVTGPDEYPYSSHRAYVRGLATPFVDPTTMLRILGGPAAYRELVGAPSDDSMPPEPDDPIEETLRPSRPDTAACSTSRLSARPLSLAVTDLALRLAVEPGALASADRDWKRSRARSLIAFVLVKRLGYPVTAVASALGRQPASVSSLLYRLADRMEADPRLKADADNLSRNV
jgi:hypothetical protein